MPTLKKFLDEAGLIQLLQEIESLDETNLKDVYWSTDNADTYPTVIFKVGDDNGSPHSIKKFTFKGDTTSPAPSNVTTRSITLTIGGIDKTITYYDTTGSAGITYTNASDSGLPGTATNVKAALDRVITKLASIVGTDEKVKQTAQTGSTGLPILTATSGTPTSGATAEAGYDTDFKFTPSSNTLIIKAATSSASGVTITPSSIKVGTTATNGAAELTSSLLKVGSGTLTSTAYSGKATLTETDLNTVATGKGSDMVAYSSSDSVKDALDDIYSLIGSGGGENSLTSRVAALEDGGNLVEGTNVTLTKDTTNHTVTISATDEKVGLNKTTNNADYHLLLTGGDGNANRTVAESKFSTDLDFNPSTKIVKLASSYTLSAGGASTTFDTQINVGGEGVTIVKKQGSTTLATGTISATNYSGTAAKATSDENGNNIVSTYATKSALEALTNQLTGSFLIVSTLPTADGSHGGIIYLIKDQEYGDTNNNIFKEYIEVNDGTLASPSWKFELLGTTDAGVDVVSIPATGSNSVASLFDTYVTNA